MHAGIVKMKVLARLYVWWPNLNKDIEDCTKTDESCQRNHNEEQRTLLHSLEYPTQPWQWIHIDFAGPFQGFMWLIVVDAEVIQMRTVTAQRIIQELRLIFTGFGLPEQIILDNGPQFISNEFKLFAKSNGIKHNRVAPYHPCSDGAAERFVQTF